MDNKLCLWAPCSDKLRKVAPDCVSLSQRKKSHPSTSCCEANVHRLHWWPRPPLLNFEVGGSEVTLQKGKISMYKMAACHRGCRSGRDRLRGGREESWTRWRIQDREGSTCRLQQPGLCPKGRDLSAELIDRFHQVSMCCMSDSEASVHQSV